jgi:hypothetical protein
MPSKMLVNQPLSILFLWNCATPGFEELPQFNGNPAFGCQSAANAIMSDAGMLDTRFIVL